MALLNDESLHALVTDGKLVDGLNPQTDWFGKDSPVQPSSIDLHIGSIYVPGTDHGEDGSEDKPLTSHTLKPGQTAVITTLEVLRLPNSIAAIGFPPSRISLQGILMTNPGHVDPGYTGPMHFTVINMGRQDFSLRKSDMIVTVLFFEMRSGAKCGFSARNGIAIPSSPKQENINKLSADFLDFNNRAKTVAQEEIHSFEIKRTIIVGVLTIVLALVAYFVPVWQGLGDLKVKVATLEQA
jgi:dCTP deaminase